MMAPATLLLLGAALLACANAQSAANPASGAQAGTTPASYRLLARTGQAFPPGVGIPLGLMLTQDGKPIPGELLNRTAKPQVPPPKDGLPAYGGGSPPPVYYATGQPSVSNYPDFLSIIPVSGRLWSFIHFEEAPGELGFLELARDARSGHLSVQRSSRVDWAPWSGLWNPCAGSVTPWMTHLGSEEYEPDARALAEATSLDDPYDATSLYALNSDTYAKVVPFMRYFGLARGQFSIADVKRLFQPYRYGHIFEAVAAGDGNYTAQKLLPLGRASFEMGLVMPDNKTVYMSDDGTNVGYYKFVADTAGNLSAGSLYAAQATQVDAVDGGTFDLAWILLGHATQAQLRPLVDNATFSFTDIFTTAKPRSDSSCPSGFVAVNTQANVGKVECLKLNKGAALAAAFLETRRFAALLGATTEFSKWEGQTYDPTRNLLYTSMSDVRYGMEDAAVLGRASQRYDAGTPNAVRLLANPCGCVYTLTLDAGFSATRMSPLLCGAPRAPLEQVNDPANVCELDGLANPDNLHFLPELGLLIIGEDSDNGHQNDAVWQLRLNGNAAPGKLPEAGALTRIITTPYGSETTGVYSYALNGSLYLTDTVQHPYTESDWEREADPQATGRAAYIGYLGPVDLAATRGKQVTFEGILPPMTNLDRHQVISTPELQQEAPGRIAAVGGAPQFEDAVMGAPEVEGVRLALAPDGSAATAGR